ncbi:hypothetical protein Bbelb_077720 [Branchiostoma belcheri]|nr:hypothetical protein Bbelb_077720 [Branchiostoma belcheri]
MSLSAVVLPLPSPRYSEVTTAVSLQRNSLTSVDFQRLDTLFSTSYTGTQTQHRERDRSNMYNGQLTKLDAYHPSWLGITGHAYREFQQDLKPESEPECSVRRSRRLFVNCAEVGVVASPTPFSLSPPTTAGRQLGRELDEWAPLS